MASPDPLAPPVGALLVRVTASDATWIERLPAVPSGWDVTVSVSTPPLRSVSTAALRRTGYRIVGVHPHRPGTGDVGCVDVLVTAALADAHPAWWARLLGVADRAFDLRLGPVQRVLGQEIALHLTG